MDLVTMSGRELQRIEVLSEVLARRRTEISAAAILGLSTRQTRRLLTAYRDGGGGALIHKARGRTSNNRLIPGIREYVIELVRSRYADFGPGLAAEVLFEKDGVKVSRETLAQWITSRENVLFARAAVNRLWGYFFGIGIVEPIDDFTEPRVQKAVSAVSARNAWVSPVTSIGSPSSVPVPWASIQVIDLASRPARSSAARMRSR